MQYPATYRTRTFRRGEKQIRLRSVPGLKYEKALWAQGIELVCGIDEVGTGAWAGPVSACAVVVPRGRRLYKVRDSKLLDPKRRQWLAQRVQAFCVCWSVGHSSAQEVQDHGLTEAVSRAVRRAVEGLAVVPQAFLIDGNRKLLHAAGVQSIVHGDCESQSIAAASVVAKVARDRIMGDLARLYPQYGFESNKGYPAPRHRRGLEAFGLSPIHRANYEPLRRLVAAGLPGRMLPAAAGLALQ